MAEESKILVDHWPTVLVRSAANWVAWIGVFAPEIIAWVLSHLDSVPSDMLSLEMRNYLRMSIIAVGVPLARIWKQKALARAVAKKEAENPTVPANLKG